MPHAPSVLVTRRLPPRIESLLLEDYGAVLNTDDHPLRPDELLAALREHDVVLCTLTDRLTRDLLCKPDTRTRLLANFGAGVNHIDLQAARDVGITVTNTPGVLTEDTADLTMLLLLAVARRATEGGRELHGGHWTGWRPTHLLGRRVAGATLGVVGFGRIGQAVARRASLGFGMRILYHSRSIPGQLPANVEAERCESLEALLGACDAVSLHVPATPDTGHLMNRRTLRLMRPGAILVNTARGDIVDEAALVEVLREGHLGGAGLDVYEREPEVSPELLALPNVFALPHLGSATVDSREAMGERARCNIAAFLAGQDPPDRVR